jgi:hypothetical protein
VSIRFLGECEDSHKDWEEHVSSNDLEGEVEDKDAVRVGTNVGLRYSYLREIFMDDAKVKIHDSKGACLRLPVDAGRTSEGSANNRALAYLLDTKTEIGHGRENNKVRK